MAESFKAFITTDVLTVGIRVGVVDGERGLNNTRDKAVFVRVGRTLERCRKGDWHATYDEALARAEVAKRRRIVVLEQVLVNLRALTFTNPENKA